MKKIYTTITLIILCYSTIKAQNVNIPDANFKAALISNQDINTNGDGEIQISEAVVYTEDISVAGLNINDLTGINAFANISSLDCGGNNLTSLNVSVANIGDIDCSNNQLTNLNITTNTALTDLNCSYNQLTNLNTLTNTALTDLNCSYNQLTNLSLPTNNALINLDCSGNYLSDLDVSNHPSLTFLQCSHNQLVNLNASGNISLFDIDCGYNQLGNLNITGDTSLLILVCWNNVLTNLDVSTNISLFGLSCPVNQLTNIDVSTNIALHTLDCSYNQLSSLDVSTNTALNTLHCYNNQLINLDVSGHAALTELRCDSNQLLTLNASGCTALSAIACHANQLNNLNISGDITLTTLICFFNQLTNLDVSTNIALIGLYCSFNQLTNLNVSANTALTSLECGINQLNNLFINNGNNINFLFFSATGNPNLTCIQVDDTSYMNSHWSFSIDSWASYSLLCTIPVSKVEISNVIKNNSSFPDPKILWSGDTSQTASTIKICADGSMATHVEFVNYTNHNSNDIRFIVESDPTAANVTLSGNFINYSVKNDTVRAEFQHPQYLPGNYTPFRSDKFKIIDQQNASNPVFIIPVEIYRAPVLMVHGIWSNRDDAFARLENVLQVSGSFTSLYPEELTYRSDYHLTNAKHFSENGRVVQIGIDKLFAKALGADFSMGKIDFIAHSMGGLLGREYVQSSHYHSDMHKFITINTPHAGTQIADYLKSPYCPSLVLWTLNRIGKKTDLGAVDDLKSSSSSIEELNMNGLNNHYNSMSIHAITTGQTCNSSKSKMCWLAQLCALTVGFVTSDNFLNYLYNGETHDLIVPSSSQQGGLLLGEYELINTPQEHEGSSSNLSVMNSVINLLNEDIISPSFDHLGFQPLTLTSNYRVAQTDNSNQNNSSSGEVMINYPISNTIFNPGQQINVDVTSNGSITNLSLLSGNESIGISLLDTNVSSCIFNYNIPDAAVGKFLLIAVGYDNSGIVNIDTVSIVVEINSVIDSIISYPQPAYIPANQTEAMSLIAFFSDGTARNISYQSNVQYSIIDTNIAVYDTINLIKAKKVGTTNLNITYLGVSITVPVIVFPADTSLKSDETLPPHEEEEDSLQLNNNLNVFPNPSENTFNIILKDSSEATLTLYDITGRIMLKKDFSIKTQININYLANGLYIIEVLNKDAIIGKSKILKNSKK